MSNLGDVGKALLILGVVIVVVGLVFLCAGRLPFLNSFGRLPGDVTVRRGNTTIAFPLVSCIIASVVLSVLLNGLLLLFRRR
jgi:small-conductance mechanosensitive channel